jgi:DNA-binding GntR family transcriptional regulator
LERQKALGLDAMDVNIILHLARHWWRADNPPHPSKKAIAACMGVDVSTIRKRIQRLERDGLIRREARYGPAGRQRTNCYHFDGLIESAKPYAAEATRTRDQRRKEDQERRTRKRADLTVVKAAAPARGRR